LTESGETKTPASHVERAHKPSRMKTRLTELLGVRYPIIQAPANFVGVPRLVAAVSNAGGFGILASGRLATGEIRDDIRAVRQLTD